MNPNSEENKYIPVETPGGVMYVEISPLDKTTGTALVSNKRGDGKKFEEAIEAVKANAEHVMQVFEELRPDEIEVSCAVKLGVEGGNIFWGLAKTSAEGTFSVKVKWAKG